MQTVQNLNQITEEPIITFHAYVISRKRGMGMAEPGYDSFLREVAASRAEAPSLGYLYLKEQLLRPVSSFVKGSDVCCLQGMVRVSAMLLYQSYSTSFWALGPNSCRYTAHSYVLAMNILSSCFH